jgi:hypothetical protein
LEKDQFKVQSKWLILVLAILSVLGLIIYGISGYRKFFTHQPSESQPNKSQISEIAKKFQLKFLREIVVARGFWPNIIFANDRLYISHENKGSVSVNVYDQGLTLQKTYKLTSGEFADHRFVHGNNHFYLVTPSYIRKYDMEFKELKKIPQTRDIPMYAMLDTKGGGFGDQLFHFADNTLFLGKRYSPDAEEGDKKSKDKKKYSGPDNLYIVEYDENLELKKGVNLKEVGHMAMNLIFKDDNLYVINADKKFNDSSLVAARYDRNWRFIDKKTISSEEKANEEFASGAVYKDGYFYISYMRIKGTISMPMPGNDFMHVDSVLKIFDPGWGMVNEKDISEIPAHIETGYNGRPGIVVLDDKVYVVYDLAGKGEPKVILKEYKVE